MPSPAEMERSEISIYVHGIVMTLLMILVFHWC